MGGRTGRRKGHANELESGAVGFSSRPGPGLALRPLFPAPWWRSPRGGRDRASCAGPGRPESGPRSPAARPGSAFSAGSLSTSTRGDSALLVLGSLAVKAEQRRSEPERCCSSPCGHTRPRLHQQRLRASRAVSAGGGGTAPAADPGSVSPSFHSVCHPPHEEHKAENVRTPLLSSGEDSSEARGVFLHLR